MISALICNFMVVLGTAYIAITVSNSLIITWLIPWSGEVKSCWVGKMMNGWDLTIRLQILNPSADSCFILGRKLIGSANVWRKLHISCVLLPRFRHPLTVLWPSLLAQLVQHKQRQLCHLLLFVFETYNSTHIKPNSPVLQRGNFSSAFIQPKFMLLILRN